MALVLSKGVDLQADNLALYYAKDDSFQNAPVLIFYGRSTTTNANANTSRIQAHVFSIAGYKSYARLTVAPASSLYSVVHRLPEEKQCQEVYRGLAVSLFKYFQEVPQTMREALKRTSRLVYPSFLDEVHAANLVSKMVLMEDASNIQLQLVESLQEQRLSWTDLDIVVPAHCLSRGGDSGSIGLEERKHMSDITNEEDHRSGSITAILASLGTPSFLPTSKLRRAPSRPKASNKAKTLNDISLDHFAQEVLELRDTEVNYQIKLQDLSNCFNTVVTEDAASAVASVGKATTISGSDVLASIQTILEVSQSFLSHLQQAIEPDARHPPQFGGTFEHPDGFLVLNVADVLLEYARRFSDPYKKYLDLSSQFPSFLMSLGHTEPSVTGRVFQTVGEQRLKSWMIEPVQRLPRYSLYIDNLTDHLPSEHPSLKKLLQAKDLITDICSLDHGDENFTLSISRLSGLVQNWPPSPTVKGRLITAADAIELMSADTDHYGVVLVLFAECFLILKRMTPSAPSARGLLAELDRPKNTPSTLMKEASTTSQPLFRLALFSKLLATRFSECAAGQTLVVSTEKHLTDSTPTTCDSNLAYMFKAFTLKGAYEGRASKWTEEVARARIEYRFPETLRESRDWSLQVLSPSDSCLGLVIAIYAFPAVGNFELRGSSRCRIYFPDVTRSSISPSSQMNGSSGFEIGVEVRTNDDHTYRLEWTTTSGSISSINVVEEDVVKALCQTIQSQLSSYENLGTIEAAQRHIAHMSCSLQSAMRQSHISRSPSRSKLRPLSPVKALTTLLGSTTKDRLSPAKNSTTTTTGMAFVGDKQGPYSLQPNQNHTTGPNTKSTIASTSELHANKNLQQLERTFNTYIVALRCRAGNIVGRSLLNRVNTDENTINALYNILNEDPGRHREAAEVPVDVLFSAFEKFVNLEWSDRMGPVLSATQLRSMQALLDTAATLQVKGRFANLLLENSPQNRRALTSIIRLLFELLETSGNDGDRGALTASFAEMLAPYEDPQECIPLLDRLVDDIDYLFEGFETILSSSDEIPHSTTKSNSLSGASVSSSGSSLRRRFGLTKLSRENSKTENESRVGMMLRTLSKKSSQSDLTLKSATGSKNGLWRSKSTDRVQPRHAITPVESAGHLPVDRSRHDQSSLQLGNTRRFELDRSSPPHRKQNQRASGARRRSSLSDLSNLEPQTHLHSHLRDTRPGDILREEICRQGDTVQRTPLHTGVTYKQDHDEKLNPISKAQAQDRVTTSSLHWDSHHTPVYAQGKDQAAGFDQADPRSTFARRPLEERKGFSDNQILYQIPSTSPRKIKPLDSRKIRDQLEKETTTSASLSTDIHKELLELRNQLPALSVVCSTGEREFGGRLKVLEKTILSFKDETSRRLTDLEAKIDNSLVVSEQHRKKLERLFNEANDENELLYDRYNSELSKMFEEDKSRDMQVILGKLTEAQELAKKVRRENQKLRRENTLLKAESVGQ